MEVVYVRIKSRQTADRQKSVEVMESFYRIPTRILTVDVNSANWVFCISTCSEIVHGHFSPVISKLEYIEKRAEGCMVPVLDREESSQRLSV
jgi:hypothetical protein